MHMWKKGCLGLVVAAGLTPTVSAQIPLTPPAAGGFTPLAAPPATQPNTLWNFLGVSKIQRQACKEYICKTQFGQLLNNGLMPLGALTGGLLGPCCPPFNQADLNKPPDSAQGAAARIKQDEAEAKARRLAVRYLSTVDCHYWPEAQEALINALRTDRNQCVRWEAALALGTGCCCSKATIKALAITVSASEEDGNPAETSERVKAAAAQSLAHCLSCASIVQPLPIEAAPPLPLPKKLVPAPQPEPAPPAEKVLGSAAGMEYYQQIRQKGNRDQIIQEARRVQAQTAVAPAAPVQPRDRSVFGILRAALSSSAPTAASPAPEAKPTAEPPAAPKTAPAPPQGSTTPVSSLPPSQSPSSIAPTAWREPIAAYGPARMPERGAARSLAAPEPLPVRPAMSAPQLVQLLFQAPYPEQREWAVNHLSCYDGRSTPEAVEAVLAAAQSDPAPQVRAACIRCLVRMNVNTWPVLNTVQALKGDADPRVKQEADLALVKLIPGLGG